MSVNPDDRFLTSFRECNFFLFWQIFSSSYSRIPQIAIVLCGSML
jgi:hypothetical protein